MCYCTPGIRTPFCHKCAQFLAEENKRLNAIIASDFASRPPASITVHDIVKVKKQTLEYCAMYFDMLDKTYPMTPPQIASSIRRQRDAIQ